MKLNILSIRIIFFATFWAFTNVVSSLAQAPSDIFISEYIEGSSLNKALEFYNGTNSAIDLAAGNYVIQMYFNGSATAGLTIPLTGIIASNDVFIISQTAAVFNSANGGSVTPDQTSSASWYNGDDAVVLRKGGASGTILDVIGQIGVDPGTEWGTGLTSTADNTLIRKAAQCSGDINSSDSFDPAVQWDGFATDNFSGLNAHSASCGTDGAAIAIAPNTLDFTTAPGLPSEVQSYTVQGTSLTSDVTISAPANFEISSLLAGPFSDQLILSASDVNSAPVTVYIRYNPLVSGVNSGNVSHLSATASANLAVQGTAVSGDITPVYVIQGSGSASALDGSIVTTEGLVTGDFQGNDQLKGFYIQDTLGDDNSATSDGIFILNNTYGVNVGDYVRLTGEVDEFFNLTEVKNLSSLTIVNSGNELMMPVAINLPVAAIGDYEKYEGMIVSFPQTLTVTETFTLGRFGEVSLSVDGRLFNPTNFIDPNDNPASGTSSNGTSNLAAVLAQQDLNNRRRILLDDGSNVQNPAIVPYIDANDKTLRSGGTLANLTGVMDYAFSSYRIHPTQSPVFNYAPRPAVPTVGLSNVKVANFNVLNYFNGDGMGGGFPTPRGANTPAEFTRQRNKIIQAISQLNADVIGLMEIENDGDGPNSAIADLVNGLNAATAAGTYSYIMDPSGANGNPGTDAIKQAIIYKTSIVTPSGLAVADMNPAHNRPPVAQTFTLNSNGEKFTVVINHFKSKSCTGAAGLDLDQNDGQSCYNNSRKLQSSALLSFISNLQTSSGDEDVITIGDYNAYGEEDPMDILIAGGLKNVLTDTYSYVFNGQSGSLDHALVTNTLISNVTGAEKWHINSDEPIIKDYNQEFNQTYVYSPDAYRSSDHDPVLVGLNLQPYAFKLQVLHGSDFEGGSYGSNFAALVDKFEDEYSNTVILSSGDNLIPSPFFNAGADRTALDATYRSVYNQHFGAGSSNFLRAGLGRADISILNLIGFNASVLGNHEFDAGTAVLSEIIGYEISGTEIRWMGAQFPYLSSNLDFSADASLNPLFTNQLLPNTDYISRPDTLRSTSPKRKIAPATIITRNGEKIGVVGVTTPILESISSTGGVKVKGSKTNNMPELATYLQPVIDQLTAQGINKIILLSHLQQIALEKELIGLLRDVDIIVAGGSSALLSDSTDVLRPGDVSDGEYPFITQNADGDAALIVNTDQEYKYLGRLVVDFNIEGILQLNSLDANINGAYATTDENVVSAWGSLATAFAPGTKGNRVKALIDAVNSVILAKDGNIIGKTNVFLEGRRTEVRTQETNLGNISSDANIYVSKQYDPAVKVSIKNGGGIRASIGEIVANPLTGEYEEVPPQANLLSGKEAGEISQLDVENSLRFNNSLSLVTVTASQLLQVLNHGVAAVAPGATPGQFTQVGGVSFSYDPTLAPGSRVRNAVIIDENGNTLEVIAKNGMVQGDPSRPIRVVTLTFLLTGGDGYPFNTFITANPGFANRVDLVTPGAPKTGNAIFTDNGSEQDAFAEYLSVKYSNDPYDVLDTEMSQDTRIQNLAVRNDSVLTSIAPVIAITNPITGSIQQAGSDINIAADASDIGGNILKVEFYNNAVKLGEDTLAPYTFMINDAEPGNYTLSAKALDNDGNVAVSNLVHVTVEGCAGSGTITREVFRNISGSLITNLTNHPTYPDSPTEVTEITSLEAPRKDGNKYGSRIRGYICAPQTGSYTFYIASDDHSELWLSTDANPDNKLKIAYLNGNVAPRAWFATPSQKSASIYLIKGATYYIEVLHKEKSASDHVAVAWRLPNNTFEAPIPGNRLSPWEASAQRISIEEMELLTSGEVTVYPVPATDEINVRFISESEGQVTIVLNNAIAGEVMNVKKDVVAGENNLQMPISELNAGVYFIHINGQNIQHSQQIIISK